MTRKFNQFKSTKANLEAGLGYEMKTDATHSKSDSHVPIDKTINHITAQINATCTHSTWLSHRVRVNKVQHNNYILQLNPYHVSYKIR